MMCVDPGSFVGSAMANVTPTDGLCGNVNIVRVFLREQARKGRLPKRAGAR